jgi:hypothetical protein
MGSFLHNSSLAERRTARTATPTNESASFSDIPLAQIPLVQILVAILSVEAIVVTDPEDPYAITRGNAEQKYVLKYQTAISLAKVG